MKAKILVIIQSFLLMCGIFMFLMSQYIGVNNSFYVFCLVASNLAYGIGIGIAIGTTIDKQ